jgi:hypothetical protein
MRVGQTEEFEFDGDTIALRLHKERIEQSILMVLGKTEYLVTEKDGKLTYEKNIDKFPGLSVKDICSNIHWEKRIADGKMIMTGYYDIEDKK